MSNIDTVGAIYQAFGTGDVATILSHVADDVAWEHWADNTAQNRGVQLLQPRTGKAGVESFFADAAACEIVDFQVLDLLAGERQVVAEVEIELKTPNGGSYRDEELHLWSFDEDGKVSRLRHYVDTAKHIAAWEA